MKPITPSSEYREGPVLDERREWHLDFIEKHLVLRQDLEIESTKVSKCYGKWLDMPKWSSWDVRNLYIGLVREHGVSVKGNILLGVGLRD